MLSHLHWTTNSSACCFHAAAATQLRRHRLEPELAEAITGPAEALRRQLVCDDIALEQFFGHLVPLASQIQTYQELASVTLAKLYGRERAATMALPYRGLLSDVASAFNACRPHLEEDLAPAIARLQESAGRHAVPLLCRVADLTEATTVVEEARVIAVLPAIGGHGRAHLAYNCVQIECVGADPLADLPEIGRLVWLLSQLNVDLPRYSEQLPGHSRADVASLAMLPPVVSAMRVCDLVPRAVPFSAAIEAWIGPVEKVQELAARLDDWWQVYVHQRPSWPSALGALAQLIGGPLRWCPQEAIAAV